jgi:hypothetical protein
MASTEKTNLIACKKKVIVSIYEHTNLSGFQMVSFKK